MITYKKILLYLTKQHKYKIIIKKDYFIITNLNRKENFHITVFQDQWDKYWKVTKKPYHLFHISSNDNINRCSTYFWVDIYTYRIKKIPSKYFKYNQKSYGFYSSTRNPCNYYYIKPLLLVFQKILYSIKIDLIKKKYSQKISRKFIHV